VTRRNNKIPAHQQAIQDRCVHPSGTFVEFPRSALEGSLVDRFEEQVKLYPDRLAASSASYSLTYAELNDRANRVAHAVAVEGREDDQIVAVVCKDNLLGIVGIIGTLKAGKTVVALDASVPEERLRYILNDSNTSIVLTDSEWVSVDPPLADTIRVLGISDLSNDGFAGYAASSIHPDSPALLVYTSGSEGRPKGVIQTHRTLLHDAMAYTNDYHICRDDRIVLVYPLFVIGGLRTIFRTLLNGASVHPWSILTQGLESLPDWLIDQRITVYDSVASTFRAFLNNLRGHEEFPNIRMVTTAGDAAQSADIELYREHFAEHCIFVNRYGQSETATVRAYFIDNSSRIEPGPVPIGYPIQDIEIRLLDDAGRPVGFDEVGEIAILSSYLSPGYWNDPELTDEKFRDEADGARRMFLSGDLGLMRPDGCLLHKGRKDSQVNIRGFRIEIGEIELALLEHGNVKETVVVLREDRPGDKRLVAYLVPEQTPGPTVGEMRRTLANRLPDYMIPATFVTLDALPRLPSGKVDRLGLPKAGMRRPNLDQPYVGPRTPLEKALVGMWAEVLELGEIGMHDRFLELGGDSLKAIRIVSRVIAHFQVDIPLTALFDSPTVGDMALAVVKHQAGAAEKERVSALLAEIEAMSEEHTGQLADGFNGTAEVAI
jgi:amino acid adenylation domain-containing protein